jgi:hypothetical protein
MARTKKTKTYFVDVRYGFTVCIPVEAGSEKDAISLAKEQCDKDKHLLDGITDDELEFIDAKV